MDLRLQLNEDKDTYNRTCKEFQAEKTSIKSNGED